MGQNDCKFRTTTAWKGATLLEATERQPGTTLPRVCGVRVTENDRPKPRRSGEMVLGSARVEAEAERTRGRDLLSPIWRKQAGAMAEKVRAPAPEYMTTIGAGGELVPASIACENSRALEFADTVERPDYVTVDASRDRLELANAAGALEMGLDVAETIGAENSLAAPR